MSDHHRHLPSTVDQQAMERLLDELASDPAVTGILLQLPIPSHSDAAQLLGRIPAHKDVDGLIASKAGSLTLGLLRPCTPSGVLALLRASKCLPSACAHAVVVDRSVLIGKPLTRYVIRTSNLAEICRPADVLVVAAGVSH